MWNRPSGFPPKLLALAAEYPGFVYPAVGVHPTRTFLAHTVDDQGRKVAQRLYRAQRKELEVLADAPAVAAIGETGPGLKPGIGGALLERSARLPALEQAVAGTPLKSILLETDAPYVKPACPDLPSKRLRKARSTGLILPAVARRVAELKGLTPEEVARITTQNAVELFGLGKNERSP